LTTTRNEELVADSAPARRINEIVHDAEVAREKLASRLGVIERIA
jgi:hypothetical protein